jgi:hypothetical protein
LRTAPIAADAAARWRTVALIQRNAPSLGVFSGLNPLFRADRYAGQSRKQLSAMQDPDRRFAVAPMMDWTESLFFSVP